MEKHMETEIAAINQQSFKDKIKSYTKHPGSFLLLLLVLVAAVLTVGVLVFLVGYILIRGIPYLKPSLFAWTYNSDNVSMLPAMIVETPETRLSTMPKMTSSVKLNPNTIAANTDPNVKTAESPSR